MTPPPRSALVRSLFAAAAGARRDLLAAFGPAFGHRPPAFRRRDGRAWPAVASALTPRTLTVTALRHLTPDAVEITLADPSGASLRAYPGQFFTLHVPVGGAVLRRAYSVCSEAWGEVPSAQVCVKRAQGGRVSGALVDTLRVGDRLDVHGPSGDYGLRPEAPAPSALVLISGGSGITPHLAMIRAALRHLPQTPITLVYASRSPSQALFLDELRALAAAHPQRLTLRLFVDDAEGGPWDGEEGRLTEGRLAEVLADHPARADAGAWFGVCGPEGLMDGALAALRGLGVPEARVFVERFTASARPVSMDNPGLRAPQAVTLRRGEQTLRFTAQPGKTLLESAVAAGVSLPWSCGMGGCGACKVRRVSGDVVLQEPSCLSAAEREAGDTLTCVGYAASALTLELPRP